MTNGTARIAFRFVLTIGIVNLFADMTYEGARGITGPFLGSLGASAAVVGVVAGLGELLGYGLRSVSGYIADRSHKYWLVILMSLGEKRRSHHDGRGLVGGIYGSFRRADCR